MLRVVHGIGGVLLESGDDGAAVLGAESLLDRSAGVPGTAGCSLLGDCLFPTGRACAGLPGNTFFVASVGRVLLCAAAVSFLCNTFGAVGVARLSVSAEGDGGTSRTGASPSGGFLRGVLLVASLCVSGVLVVGELLGVVGGVSANLARQDAAAAGHLSATSLLHRIGQCLNATLLFTAVVVGGGGSITAGGFSTSKIKDERQQRQYQIGLYLLCFECSYRRQILRSG